MTGASTPVPTTAPGADEALDTEFVSGVRRFAREVLDPAETLADELAAQSVGDSDEIQQAVSAAADLGCTRLATPVELGGLGASLRSSFVVAEEIAGGAPGFAGLLLLEDLLTSVLAQSLSGSSSASEHAVRALLAKSGVATAWALVAASPDQPVGLPNSGLDLYARTTSPEQAGAVERDGAGWRLRSLCLRAVPNAAYARHLLLFVADADGVDLCLVDVASPGISRATLTTSGLRAQGFADVLFEDVRVPADAVVQTAADGAAHTLETLLTLVNAGVGFKAAGLLRSTHVATTDYCRMRVQGGKPIIEHDSVAGTLWAAQSTINALRSTADRAALAVAGGSSDLRLGLRVRTEVERTLAFTVVDLLALLGAYGVSHEYPLGKMYRDATTLTMSGVVATADGVFARVSTF